MTLTLDLVLLIVAAILFLVAGLGVAAGRLNLVALGLLAWVLTLTPLTP